MEQVSATLHVIVVIVPEFKGLPEEISLKEKEKKLLQCEALLKPLRLPNVTYHSVTFPPGCDCVKGSGCLACHLHGELEHAGQKAPGMSFVPLLIHHVIQTID